MARAVVLLGPPAIGKSYVLQFEKEKYQHCQILSIDKDILNRYFFEPPLRKEGTPSPTVMLGQTTSRLLQLATNEYRGALELQKELIFFLQGASLGGIRRDVETLALAGIGIEIILLTTNEPLILHKRITSRAEEQGSNLIGAPLMELDVLRNMLLECNRTFHLVVTALDGSVRTAARANQASPLSESPEELFLQLLRDHKSLITYSSYLTRIRKPGTDITSLSGKSLERNITLDFYNQTEITLSHQSIRLGNRDESVFDIHTA